MKDKNGITINFTLGTTTDMLAQIAASYSQYSRAPVKVDNNRIHIPATLGAGLVECVPLFDGLSCIICDVTYRQPTRVVRHANTRELYYVIGCRYGYGQPHFAASEHGNEGPLKVNSDCIFVHSAQIESSFLFPADLRCRTFTIIANRSFAMEELRLQERSPNHSIIQEFISNKPFSNISPLPLMVQHGIDQTFEQLRSTTPGFVKRTFLVSAAYHLISHWYMQFFLPETVQETYYPSNVHLVIKMKDQYISNFENPPPTIEELAKGCNMSVTKFKSLFKSLFGMSCYQYYQVQRMEYAKRLLARQQYSIKEIAYMTGFQNTANFTRSFKKAFDILPRDFQKVLKNMES